MHRRRRGQNQNCLKRQMNCWSWRNSMMRRNWNCSQRRMNSRSLSCYWKRNSMRTSYCWTMTS
jgi:hypothetical protein